MATEIIRKPRRLYPLPDKIRSLDKPWADVAYSRHTRVNVFQEGYRAEDGDNPMIRKPPRSRSKLLSKL